VLFARPVAKGPGESEPHLFSVAAAGGDVRELGPGSEPALSTQGQLAYILTGHCRWRTGVYVEARRLTNECRIVGTGGADRLVGSADADLIEARGGDDTVLAGWGLDRADSGDGDDVVSGGYEADVLHGGVGADQLDGGGGRDLLVGGPGRDRISDGIARDSIDARDGGPDVVSCGPQRDFVLADEVDRVANDCEAVRR
jgi:hypothetical protein